jgi:hypothetical protein
MVALVGHHDQSSKQSINLHLFALEAAYPDLVAQDPQTFFTPKMGNNVMKGGFDACDALDVETDDVRARSIHKGLGLQRRGDGGQEWRR